MNHMHCLTRVFLLLSLFVFLPLSAFAHDVKGSKDHPLITRYPGSVIRDYSQREFDEYELILGKVKREKGKDIAEKTQRLEGKVTQFRYEAPKGRSVLEVYRNYETALSKAGFQTLYSCRDDRPVSKPYASSSAQIISCGASW